MTAQISANKANNLILGVMELAGSGSPHKVLANKKSTTHIRTLSISASAMTICPSPMTSPCLVLVLDSQGTAFQQTIETNTRTNVTTTTSPDLVVNKSTVHSLWPKMTMEIPTTGEVLSPPTPLSCLARDSITTKKPLTWALLSH